MTLAELQALLPEAAIEFVGERQEAVIYTGWTVTGDDELVPMSSELADLD